MATTILVAGATGNLGSQIITSLREKGANVRAVGRPGTDPEKINKLEQQGVEVVPVDMSDAAQLTEACEGVACVVSALQRLHDVIVDTQTALLNAALAAGVPRFIPSDFSSDFTKLADGDNRNFDLRRTFKERIDKTDIQATSILNGGFAYLLTFDMPLLDYKKKQVGYWEDPDWRIDFTTVADTAAFTAAAALDASTPRFLRIASFQISPNELAAAAEQVSGTPFAVVRLGSRADLAAYNQRERAAHPEGEQELYPRWQQSQYIYSMFSVQNDPLDNDRYPDVQWTSVQDVLTSRK